MYFYLLVFIKFIIGFTIVIFYFNQAGKTQISQMTPIDLIGNFILGGIIGGVIYSDSISLPRYIAVLIIGTVLMHGLNYIAKKFDIFRALALGNTIVFIKNGSLLMDNIQDKRNKIDIINIMSMLHSRGIGSLQEIYYAQIEPNGQLTIKNKEENEPSVLLILNGEIKDAPSHLLEIDEGYVQHLLNKYSLQLEDIFMAEYYNGKVMFALYEGKEITVPFYPVAKD